MRIYLTLGGVCIFFNDRSSCTFHYITQSLSAVQGSFVKSQSEHQQVSLLLRFRKHKDLIFHISEK